MNGLKLRSSQGCWTCRLRRKKCDEARPVCAACGGLEIDCHYSDAKPEWMDGGPREKQMADELKAQVKQKANERRERKWGLLPTMTDFSPSAQEQRQESDRVMSDAGDPVPSEDGYNPSSTTLSESSQSPAGSSSTSASSPPTNDESQMSAGHHQPVRPAVGSFPEHRSEVEVNFTMIYLDYVVPFLFPFYRPCLLESSRGWMLVLLMKNRALFHTALSLANWLYAVLFDSLNGQHSACRRANWAELQVHQETAIKALQEDIKALNERGVANAFLESVGCMQSVIQLLEFDIAMADMSNWQAHHDVAVALFDQLITHHAVAPMGSWMSILDRIGAPFFRVRVENERHILASDQSAFKFYTAYLLWIDVIAATALGTAPRLQKYHAELLHGDDPVIQLGDYVGCESWVVLEIAEAAALATWKREQHSKGSLSMIELVHRACAIQTRLRTKMASLPSVPTSDRAGNIYDPSAYHPVTPYSGFHEMLAESSSKKSQAVSLHTRIWAQATMTYVMVLASGLQPSLPEIQTSVEATMALLRALPSPLALRTVIWPFALTGCLAPAGQEAFFTGLVADMGAMHVFGTVREALNIMQSVWQHRESGCCAEPQMWDVATCFSVLGHLSLLV
ncbi:fungal-specific transcription factor domain-containing protein [Xylaria bambusicola]|uniref:fungal-specific transcription factor domain-containing protein n=1 Tax=Xylaria bambusicola TaxID=326684 RepID=UPI00200729C2|nr:fungal-specific transcription factor domain-containing protein [Xylaria bambusicola]KAI0509106.1 fungal-specific transcription factor domain-containing protein [Xylaria bambusicola]